jgi:hypothetical protein
MIAAFSSIPSSLFAEFLVSLVAMLGGMVVFVGLVMEKIAEHGDDKYSPPFLKPYKRLGKWGWIVLMIGIVLEVGVAGWSASVDWQTRQMAIKNDPLDQPIADVTAIVILDVKGTNLFRPSPDFPRNSYSIISFYETNIYYYGTNGIRADTGLDLAATDARAYPHLVRGNLTSRAPNFYGYALKFERVTMPFGEYNDLTTTNDMIPPTPTVREVITKFKIIQIYIDFIPKNSELFKGYARVFINGIRQDYLISVLKTDKQLSELNPGTQGIFLFATNTIP